MRRSDCLKARPLAIAILGLTLVLSPGCGATESEPTVPRAPAPPVASSDWAKHLSLPPESVTRNWVLSNNTMLVELPYFKYELFDPRLDRGREIVALSRNSFIREVTDSTVEFVADDFRGIPYLAQYDLSSEQFARKSIWYAMGEPRSFGLTAAYEKLIRLDTSEHGLDICVSNWPGTFPYTVIRPDKTRGELVIEFPGFVTDASPAAMLSSGSLPPLVTAAGLTPGVKGSDGTDLPGLTLRLKLAQPDWSRLTYALDLTAEGGGTMTFALRLSDREPVTDTAPTLGMPPGWDNWMQWPPPAEPIVRSWALPDGLMLYQSGGGYENRFWICDPRARLSTLLVNLGERAGFRINAGKSIEFLDTGPSASPIRDFPRLAVYDMASRGLHWRDINLALTTPVTFGGATTVIDRCEPCRQGLRLVFKVGPSAAGGSGPPLMRTRVIADAHQFLIEFPMIRLENGQAGPIQVDELPFVESAVLEPGIAGTSGEAAPGVTLRLTLNVAKWTSLTYRFEGTLEEPEPSADFDCALVLTFSDEIAATDISGFEDPKPQ